MTQKCLPQVRRLLAMQDRRLETYPVQGQPVALLGRFLPGSAVEIFPDKFRDAPPRSFLQIVKSGVFAVQVHDRICGQAERFVQSIPARQAGRVKSALEFMKNEMRTYL